MALSDQQNTRYVVRQADLMNDCYRLNRILNELSSRIDSVTASPTAGNLTWVKYGKESELTSARNLPDGALFICTDSLTIFEVRSNVWVRVFWRSVVTLANQNAGIAATNIQDAGVVAPLGDYLFSYSMITTTAGAAGNVQLNMIYTEPGGTAMNVNVGVINTAVLGNMSFGSALIRANGVANIQFATTFTPGAGAVYRLDIVVRGVAP